MHKRAQNEFTKNFLELTVEEKLQFVHSFDKEAKKSQSTRGKRVRELQDELKNGEGKQLGEIDLRERLREIDDSEANHFFTMLKQLTLTGFFTSEVGMTKALRYVKIPGKYDGHYPYQKGDRAFS